MKTSGLLIVSFVLLPAAASAGGFYVGDIGTQGMARGGAFVAAPESLVAIHYNPAGLSRLKGLHFEGTLSLLDGAFRFDRECPCIDPSSDDALQEGFLPVENQAGFRPIPFVSLGYGFSWLDLTVAVAAYGPHGAAYSYGPRELEVAQKQAQRYSLIDSTSTEANYQLGFGLSPFKGLRLGGSVMVYSTQSEQALHVYANTVLTPTEDAMFDIPIVLSFDRPAAFNWSLGASYELLPGVNLGASIRGMRTVRAQGSIETTTPEILADFVEIQDGEALVEFELPAIARAGVEVRKEGLGRLEAAVVYEGWSVHDRIRVKADDIKLIVQGEESRLGELILERQWADSVSLRIGGELELLEPYFGLSAGYFYEPSAIPTERLQVSAFDLDKHGLSIGARTEVHGVRLHAALQHVILQETSVTDTEVLQPAPLEPPFGTNERLTQISNGLYSGSYTIVSVGLSIALDPLLAEDPTSQADAEEAEPSLAKATLKDTRDRS